MHKRSMLFLLCLGLLMSCAPKPVVVASLPPADVPTIDAPFTPSQSEDCKKRGGIMQAGGMMGMYSCVIPYADAGKACQDKSDCQGKCLTHDFGHDFNKSKPEEKVTGQCQKNSSHFGCYAEVRGGKIGPALCVD